MTTRSLSVVIPVFNEENAIREILEACRAQLELRGGEWEVVVVDNASTDRTCEIVEQFGRGDTIRLLRNDANRGKGYSIRRGMLAARFDLRLMCDADCSSSLVSLPAMEQAMETASIVVGSRVARGSQIARRQPLRRRVVGSGFLLLTRMLLGRLAHDVYCGFKLWSGEAAEEVFSRVELDGWVFDAEALALGKRLGYQIVEVGITWTDRPDSRLSIRNVLLPVVGELISVRNRVRRVA